MPIRSVEIGQYKMHFVLTPTLRLQIDDYITGPTTCQKYHFTLSNFLTNKQICVSLIYFIHKVSLKLN